MSVRGGGVKQRHEISQLTVARREDAAELPNGARHPLHRQLRTPPRKENAITLRTGNILANKRGFDRRLRLWKGPTSRRRGVSRRGEGRGRAPLGGGSPTLPRHTDGRRLRRSLPPSPSPSSGRPEGEPGKWRKEAGASVRPCRASVKWGHQGSVTVVDPSVIRNSRWDRKLIWPTSQCKKNV